MIRDEKLTSFEEKLNYNQLKKKSINLVYEECNSQKLFTISNVSNDEIGKLIELAYTLAFFENYTELKMDKDNFQDSFNDIVQSMLDIISKYILNKVMKKGL
ncbi:hypothetical protein [Vibrio natriegens]|uniref:hypothetical protein n=1 Tax=Vibrio natriegens TaxID=691 RepID=UPI00390B4B21